MNYTLITGASGGIGEASAREFAAKKHNLILYNQFCVNCWSTTLVTIKRTLQEGSEQLSVKISKGKDGVFLAEILKKEQVRE